VIEHVVLADDFNTQLNVVQPLLDGIFQGSAYGLLGLGLVLLYKSNRIFNFAQGEFATVAALVAYLFDTGYKYFPQTPFLISVLLGLTASVLVALATERVVIRPMFNRPRVVLVVGTIGVALLLIGIEGMIFNSSSQLRSISEVFSLDPPYLGKIDQVPVYPQDLLKLGALVALAVGALLFFRYTRTGTAILAVSQDATAARVVGISVERISMITWAIAGLLGGIAGILLASNTVAVTPGYFTGTTLIAAFTAAVLGGFTSLPGAFVGGLTIGLVQSFTGADSEFIPGLSSLPSAQSEVALFVVLLVVLLIRPRGLLGSET
jgi:branched-chain amino acid transport system permease protein